jgi:Flp pilus assembly protein TadG
MRRAGRPRSSRCPAPRWQQENGEALVEFALILPIVVSLLMGLVTGGLAYNKKIAITDAVRGAARYGATLNDSTTFATSVRDRLVQLSAGELAAGDVCVELVRSGSPNTVTRSWYAGAANSSCPASFGTAPATPTITAGSCVVKVWAMKTAQLQAIFLNSDLHLKGGSVAGFERGVPAGTC